MRLQDIKIKDVIDMYNLPYRRAWYGSEYVLYEDWKPTSWRRFNEKKNKVFDLSWKGRPYWSPLSFVIMFNRCSKEEAIQLLSERFYLDNYKKKNVRRKTNIKF